VYFVDDELVVVWGEWFDDVCVGGVVEELVEVFVLFGCEGVEFCSVLVEVVVGVDYWVLLLMEFCE